MPAYHSNIPDHGVRLLCGFPIQPLRTTCKGNAPPCQGEDIVDEALHYFKANMFFKNFEVKSASDKLLIYVTLYIQQCITKLPHKSKGEAEKLLYSLAIENFSLPGDKTFALGGLVSAPPSRADAGSFFFFSLSHLLFACDATNPRVMQNSSGPT
eukprot:TRINITY_DN4831_c0_g1_i1.p1 TRINITY_DN4831_c0_g1~~TRINITY_DN4831_c0_g1_i1.p1  ORF type:complete len:155 (-),score=41.30 TRINITY_DN4831_c0_g1_i1:2-466(-)